MSEKTKWLLLTPTPFEHGQIAESFSSRVSWPVETCGFGPIIPAAKTVQLIQRYTPENVLLIGIAGRYRRDLEIGKAYSFERIVCDGVGVGNLETFQSAEEMGWSQWDDKDRLNAIGDILTVSRGVPDAGLELLTVCSASGNKQEAQTRKARYPNAMAEDMEAFSVAAACKLCETPLFIVRGISNQAGDRDKAIWKIREALESAADLAEQIMDNHS